MQPTTSEKDSTTEIRKHCQTRRHSWECRAPPSKV